MQKEYPSLSESETGELGALATVCNGSKKVIGSKRPELKIKPTQMARTATPSCSVEMLFPFRYSIIRAARLAEPGISGLEGNMTWKRVKIHGVPVACYVSRGSFGTKMLLEELEAENDGVKISAAVIWSGSPSDVKARHAEGMVEASSVPFTVLGEVTFGRLHKSGLRLLDRRYRAEAFEEEQLDVQCGRCSRWAHIEVLHTPAAPGFLGATGPPTVTRR